MRCLQPDACQCLHRAPFCRRTGDAGIEERQLDLRLRRGARQQVETLKDEADLAVADVSLRAFAELAHLLAANLVAAARGPVEQTDDIHQRALTRPTGADDGDVLAALHR
jgi:hypothetical protein